MNENRQTGGDPLAAYAEGAGFRSRERALEFLKSTFRLNPLPDATRPASEVVSRPGPETGFRVARSTPDYLAVEVFGSLDSGFSLLPPCTRLLPPFFSPKSRTEGWWLTERLFGHIYALTDLNGERRGFGVLVTHHDRWRWFIGRTLAEASGERRRVERASVNGNAQPWSTELRSGQEEGFIMMNSIEKSGSGIDRGGARAPGLRAAVPA